MTYLISIANEKGGVAKTTTTVSLGAALAEKNFEVLLVDLDPQANLTLALGVDPNKVKSTSLDLLVKNAPVETLCVETAFQGITLLPARGDLVSAESILPSKTDAARALRQALRNPALRFHYVLLDCPPFLGSVTRNAILASDLLLLPTQAEFFSINALRNMLGLIRLTRNQGNPRLTYRLLITLFDRRNSIHRKLNDQLRATFGAGVLNTVIDIDTRLRESTVAGEPILIHSPKSRSSLQYRALADEVLAYVNSIPGQ